MMRLTLLLCAVAALAVPAAAAAKTVDVKGPQAVLARGFVKAELTMSKLDGKPVTVRATAGFVRFVDLDDDLEVRCLRGKARETKRDDGKTVFACLGPAAARGSHFELRAFSIRFGMLVPEGAAGEVSAARLRTREPGKQRSERPDKKQEQDNAASSSGSDDEIAEIEAALAEIGQ
jgi:hypothetical protein